jgi:preprotein translocase subunit SecA
MLGAANFAEYGDTRAVELLNNALEDHDIVDPDTNGLANHAVIDICDAIVELAGELADRQQRKLDRVKAIHLRWREKHDDEHAVSDGEGIDDRPGRNDPCYCGSGKKYKKCHLVADENGARD